MTSESLIEFQRGIDFEELTLQDCIAINFYLDNVVELCVKGETNADQVRNNLDLLAKSAYSIADVFCQMRKRIRESIEETNEEESEVA